jgi:hypothetical protein
MNINSISFNKRACEVIPDVRIRSRAMASAIAAAITQVLPIPSSEMEDPASYYTGQIFEQARMYISTLNESVVFDVHCCADLTRKLWMMRYFAAYPRMEALIAGQYGFFDTLMGVGIFVDEGSYYFLNENKQAIFDMMYEARIMVAEVQGGN